MKKTIKKIISLVLVFVTLFGFCFSGLDLNPSAGATTIASLGVNADYRWKWTKCQSVDDLNSTGIFNTTYTNVNNLKFEYVFVLVAGNSDTCYYFADLPADNKEYNWNSKDAKGSIFDPDKNFASTSDRTSSAYLTYSGTKGTDSAVFEIFKTSDGYVSYNSGKITKNTSAGSVYGLWNDGDTDFRLKTNNRGESFTFKFDSSRANSSKGNVMVVETDSTSYHWAYYNDGLQYGETKKDYGDSNYFYLWVGHYESCPGLSSGSYEIKENTLLCDDYENAVIMKGATLTINQGAALTVKGNLYIEGEVYNYGTIIVDDGGEIIIGYGGNTYGKLINEDYLGSFGSLVIDKGGRLNITSNIESRSIGGKGGYVYMVDYTMFSVSEGNFVNSGTVRINNAGFIYFEYSDFNNCSSGKIIVPASDSATLDSVKKDYLSTKCNSFINNGSIYSGTRKLS